MPEKKLRKSYTAAFKLKVVNFSKETSKLKAAKNFGVDRRRVQEWCQQQDDLKLQQKSSKCLPGRGRKVAYPDIEEKLLKWMKERREAGGRVTGKSLRREALHLHKLYGNQSFAASSGWYRMFKRRNNIVMRRTTHISQKPKEVTDDLIHRFQRQIIKLRINRDYDLAQIGNMDETPVWLEMPGSYTLDYTGEKEIRASTTGHHKERVTVLLSGLADGTKLSPLVLLPGVRPPKDHDIPAGIVVYMCGSGKGSWSNAEVTMYWLAKIWGVNNRKRRLLVWDTFRGHTTDQVKDKVRGYFNSDLVFIPPGCTGIVQPADVSWNAPFKRHLEELYDEWQFSAPKELTRYGNPKPPSKPLLLKWIKQAWDLVTPEIVQKSFKKCGISNAMDGSEDDLFNNDCDTFEGFTPEEAEDAEEYSANVASEKSQELTPMEISFCSSDEDSVHADDFDCDPMSPGN